MKRISSQSTFLIKRVIPAAYFAGLLVMVFTVLLVAQQTAIGTGIFVFWLLVVCLGLTLVGVLILKKFVSRLVDEAWLDGDALILKMKKETVRVGIDEIESANYRTVTNPQTATIRLKEPSSLGKIFTVVVDLKFFPMPFHRNPMVVDLIEKVEGDRDG